MSWELFATNLYIHELLHFLVASILSVIIYRQSQSFKLVAVVFLVSFLIDADHYLEGFLVNGFDLSWLFREYAGTYWQMTGRMTLLFHDWEVLPIIFFLGRNSRFRLLTMTVVLAAAGHYLVDTAVYVAICGMSVFEYSLIYRLIKNFSFNKLCNGC